MEPGNKVMVIVAHPDDAEFSSGGTVAKWTREGVEVLYVICTNGNKGTSDLSMTSERLAQIRRTEQMCAAQVLGVKEVIFLDYPDGELEDTPAFRGQLVRLLRQHRPDAVITMDPFRRPHFHRDHRVAGTVALDATFPYARDHLFYPEHMAEGLTPHKVGEAYLSGSENPDFFVDIKDSFDIKIQALLCHKSQVTSTEEELRARLTDISRRMALVEIPPYTEAFRRIEFRR